MKPCSLRANILFFLFLSLPGRISGSAGSASPTMSNLVGDVVVVALIAGEDAGLGPTRAVSSVAKAILLGEDCRHSPTKTPPKLQHTIRLRKTTTNRLLAMMWKSRRNTHPTKSHSSPRRSCSRLRCTRKKSLSEASRSAPLLPMPPQRKHVSASKGCSPFPCPFIFFPCPSKLLCPFLSFYFAFVVALVLVVLAFAIAFPEGIHLHGRCTSGSLTLGNLLAPGVLCDERLHA